MATASLLNPESTGQVSHPVARNPPRTLLAETDSLALGVVPQDRVRCGIQGTVVDAATHLSDQYVIVDRIRGPHECL